MELYIKIDDVIGYQVILFVNEYLYSMIFMFLLESIYVLGLERFRVFEVIFWSVWESDELVGCGVFKELDSWYGEIKLMCMFVFYLRKGVVK